MRVYRRHAVVYAVAWLLGCWMRGGYGQTVEKSPPPETTEEKQDVVVDDYLAKLSNAELETICKDRGFEIAPRVDGPLRRDDYLEAARRCLSLEDEMNAILAENPDLAAELESEIERMKAAKEALEREREAILAQKDLLEEQLRSAGVDIGASNLTSVAKSPQSMTLEEVLKESFTQLFERVHGDFKMIQKVLHPFLQPVFKGLQVAWKYTKPTLIGLWGQAKPPLLRLWGEVQARVKQQFQKHELKTNNATALL